MTLDTLLNPMVADQNSATQALIGSLSVRMVTHRLLDPSPTLAEAMAGNLRSTILNFMEYCFNFQIPLDWKSHLVLVHWYLVDYKSKVPNGSALRLESMAAAASAWAHDSYVNPEDRFIAIVDGITGQACGAVRPIRFIDPVRVYGLMGHRGILSGQWPPDRFAYGTGSGWTITGWRTL